MKKNPIKNANKNAKVYAEVFWIVVLIASLISIASTCNGQVSMQIRSGYSLLAKEPIVSGAINFAAHGFALTPEMIISTGDNSPAFFGLKMSYQIKFIEAGYGRYFTLFSTDKYDSYRNGWSNLFFVSAHWKKFFLEYDYINGSMVSIGFKETIGRLQ